jgi:hypothetical protein
MLQCTEYLNDVIYERRNLMRTNARIAFDESCPISRQGVLLLKGIAKFVEECHESLSGSSVK